MNMCMSQISRLLFDVDAGDEDCGREGIPMREERLLLLKAASHTIITVLILYLIDSALMDLL